MILVGAGLAFLTCSAIAGLFVAGCWALLARLRRPAHVRLPRG